MYPRLSETFVLNEMLGLEEAGVDVSVFSLRLPDDGRFHGELAQLRAPVQYLPAFAAPATAEAFTALRDLKAQPQVLDTAVHFLGMLPPDRRAGVMVQALHLAAAALERRVTNLHAPFMTVAAHTAFVAHLFTGIPLSVTAHAKDIYRDGVDVSVFRRLAEEAVVVTVCEANRRHIVDGLLDGRAEGVTTIYNGIDLDGVRPTEADRERGLILAVGRLVEKKGFDVLIDAVLAMRTHGVECRLVVIGEGAEKEPLVDQARRLGLGACVEFLGAQPSQEVARWMDSARVLAAPCLVAADGNRDALPTVVIESLAHGLPVVSTPVGGIPEIVDDGRHGSLVPPSDAPALAGALRRLLTDDETWATMSAAGPARAAERFDRRRTVPRLVEAFTKTVGSGVASPDGRNEAQ